MAHRADLFDGRSQLFIKHFMLAPGQTGQCVGCSFEVDHLEGILAHLENHDVSYAVVARAPIEEIEAIRKRMGWRFTWVSSYHSDFNYDFNVSFRPHDVAAGHAYYNYGYTNPGLEDRSGDSVFFKNDAGDIFHTYSTYGRGGEEFLGAYRYLDVMPKGRDENGPTGASPTGSGSRRQRARRWGAGSSSGPSSREASSRGARRALPSRPRRRQSMPRS